MLRRRPTGRALLREEGSLSMCGGSQSSYLPPPPQKVPTYICMYASGAPRGRDLIKGPPVPLCFLVSVVSLSPATLYGRGSPAAAGLLLAVASWVAPDPVLSRRHADECYTLSDTEPRLVAEHILY